MFLRRIGYGYLPIQLDPQQPLGAAILEEWKAEMSRGLFTLGPAVDRLEKAWAGVCGTKYALGVNSGTDALIIALKVLGIGPGDEVITCPNTFVATVGAIVAVGAKPVFVDVGSNYLMDYGLVEQAITAHTKAFIPVDLTGNPVHPTLLAKYKNILVIRDACQSIGALIYGQSPAKFADLTTYSLHPLKNIHACGDGGIIVTDSYLWAECIRAYRNHGFLDRDHVIFPGINSRLDTLQAIAGWHILQQLEQITFQRNTNAEFYDRELSYIKEILLPPRPGAHIRQSFHTYVIIVEGRTELQQFLAERGIETKVHYPIPVHLQKGYEFLGYKHGDFPNVEYQADHILSLPIHEYLQPSEITWIIESIKMFYDKRS